MQLVSNEVKKLRYIQESLGETVKANDLLVKQEEKCFEQFTNQEFNSHYENDFKSAGAYRF